MVRMYGFSKLMCFNCLCFGKTGICWKINFKPFKFYFWRTPIDEVIFQTRNTPNWYLLGFITTDETLKINVI